MKSFIFITVITAVCNTSLFAANTANPVTNWPGFTLQYAYTPQPPPLIDFEAADFTAIEREIAVKNIPMIPEAKSREISRRVMYDYPEAKWRVSLGAFAGSHYSGYSQSIGMSTMLIKDELFLDAEVTHVKYHFKNDALNKYYGDGDKYRVDTTLHWYPAENFSLHLGVGGFFDK